MWSTLPDADIAATGAERAHSEGIIDLLSQAEAAEVTILFKEAGPATAGQRPDQARRRRCHRPDRAFGGGGHARAAGATVDAPLDDARPRVLAEAGRLVAEVRPLTWLALRSVPGSTASSSSPSRPVRPRTTSSRSSAGWPRRSGSVTAGRSTRSPRACCRSSSATPRGSSSTTWATARPTARRSASVPPRRPTTSRAS